MVSKEAREKAHKIVSILIAEWALDADYDAVMTILETDDFEDEDLDQILHEVADIGSTHANKAKQAQS